MPAHQEVEFKTLDKLTLKGWLYPASRRGPGIILTPGVSPFYFCCMSIPSGHGLPPGPILVPPGLKQEKGGRLRHHSWMAITS